MKTIAMILLMSAMLAGTHYGFQLNQANNAEYASALFAKKAR